MANYLKIPSTMNEWADFWYYDVGMDVFPANTIEKKIFENKIKLDNFPDLANNQPEQICEDDLSDMHETDQLLSSNTNQDNKKFYFSPILGCLDGCSKCEGTYYSTTINDYSLCKCICHKEQNRIRLISDNERIPRPEAFAKINDEYIKKRGDPDVV